MSTDLAPWLHHLPDCSAWAPVSVALAHPATEAKPCECGLRQALDRIGAESRWFSRAAEVALMPNGSHTLIDGYCPDCQGGCMRGFLDPEPVPYVQPDPFGTSA